MNNSAREAFVAERDMRVSLQQMPIIEGHRTITWVSALQVLAMVDFIGVFIEPTENHTTEILSIYIHPQELESRVWESLYDRVVSRRWCLC